MIRALFALLVVLGSLFAALPVRAAGILVADEATVNEWPNQVVFTLNASSDAEITFVRLQIRYGSGQSTSGATPTFAPGQTVSAEHKLSTRSIPSGTMMTYFYTIEDASGNRLVTEPKQFLYLDTRYQWQTVNQGNITIYYHDIPDTRPKQLLEAGLRTVAAYKAEAGVELQTPVRIMLYNSVREMEPALGPRSPSEQGTILGVNYGQYDAIYTTDSRDLLSAVSTMNHEVAHKITGEAAGNAFVEIPAWLNEGLSVYFQEDKGAAYQGILNSAVRQNRLLPLRHLTVYPGRNEDKLMVYAQGGSLVGYLIKTYGADKMAELLAVTKDGKPQDEALTIVYGKDRDGIDLEWRKSIGSSQPIEAADPVPGPATPVPQPRPSPASASLGSYTPALVAIGAAVLVIALLGAAGIIWRVRRS